jgi:DNA-binding CsgD family transcriptional regulator
MGVVAIDYEALFRAFQSIVGRETMTDDEIGSTFTDLMSSLVHLDHVVVFAYSGKERPIDLFRTFDPDENVVFVTLYQAGPYLLDPFYHTAVERLEGVFRMRELAPDRFFSSEYYRTYYVQTGLAEEIGFFVPLPEDITVVLSLMRKQDSGPFQAKEFALLKAAEKTVAKFVRHYWASLAPRFEVQRHTGANLGKRGSKGEIEEQAGDAVWRELNLTNRETAIVDLVLRGHSSESIGLKLNISTGTVKVHRRNVYRKLNISSQTQLLSIYLKMLNRH